MAPLQIILLLLLVRLPRSLDAANAAEPLSILAPAGHQNLVFASFLGSMAALVLLVLWRTRRALKTLNNPSASSVALMARTDWLSQWARWATIGLTGLHLYVLGLPAIVTSWLVHAPFLRRVPLLPEAFYLAPALSAWIAFWAAAYYVERANRERALPFRLAAGLPAHPAPSLWQFLSMQMRHNLYILVPVALAAIVGEIAGPLTEHYPWAGQLGVFAAFLGLLLLMPWFITQAWSTVPLTGPLRAKLDALARQYHLRFRNILIWKTHNAVSNAAILGYLPFSRYFLMTDALLETLSDEQLEAVFAHEVGHGVHRHAWWYMGGIIVPAMFLSADLTDLTVSHLPASILGALGGADEVGTLGSLLLIGLLLMVGFPFISRRFEHQADWFAAQHMAKKRAEHPNMPTQDMAAIKPAMVSPVPGGAMADAQTGGAAGGAAPTDAFFLAGAGAGGDAAAIQRLNDLTTSRLDDVTSSAAQGAEVFISSLEAIADLAHRARNKKGWMHPSIRSRIELLRTLAENPLARRRFRRRMIATRLYLVAVVLAALAFTGYAALHDQPNAAPPSTQPSAPDPSVINASSAVFPLTPADRPPSS